MMQRIVVFCFLIFLCLRCKDVNSNKKGIGEADSFMITLSIIVKEKDVIEIFYINSKDGIRFSEEKKIRKSVEGTNDVQTISFLLPIEALSNTFRIDLGQNRLQQGIVVENITISYKGKDIFIKNDYIYRFFHINQYLELYKNGDFRIKEINDKRDPFIISSPLLLKKIELELLNKS